MKKTSFTAYLSPIEGPMIHHVIILPEETAQEFRVEKGAVRVVCSIENGEEFPCALNPRDGNYVIMASKQLIKKHRLKNDVPFTVTIYPDKNNGLELPEEMQELLLQDEWGAQLFEKLLPGRKRSLLYYIRTGKSVDTRIKRSMEILEKLKTESLHFQKQQKSD